MQATDTTFHCLICDTRHGRGECSKVSEKTETYNGWKNYPTWAVNLWLSNDEGLYREGLERTAEAINADTSGNPRVAVMDGLRDWVQDELAPDLGATFSADLLGYALDCVDWYEIADAWIESVNEQA